MESFGADSPQQNRSLEEMEKEKRAKEIEGLIKTKRDEWRGVEEKNYSARMGSGVDYIKLKEGDVAQQDLYNANKATEAATKLRMAQLDAEIEDLDKERMHLLYN